MLRASSEALGEQADLQTTVGDTNSDTGVADGRILIEFAEAAVKGEPLNELRARLVTQVGPAAAGQTIATIAAFSGLVRVADGTGIPIDDGMAAASVDIRKDLELDGFTGSANSAVDTVGAEAFSTVDALWSHT